MALNLNRKVGPLPLWAWGAGTALGAGALVLIARKRKAPAAADAGTAQPLAFPAGDYNGGDYPGGGGGGGGGGSTPAPAPTPTQPPVRTNPKAPKDPLRGKFTPVPISQLDPIHGAINVLHTNISNPAGSAVMESKQPGNFYTPSLLDLASEQPGGIMLDQMQNLANSPGQTYSIYTSPAGASLGSTGPIINAAQAVTGERYTQLPNGQLQVIY